METHIPAPVKLLIGFEQAPIGLRNWLIIEKLVLSDLGIVF